MKGLDLCERYYQEYGAPMIREQFPHLESILAVGLAGSGSECFGYDDEISRDHDFEPGFCIFLPDEETVDRKTAFMLERAYAKLPAQFMGYERAPLSPVGGNRHGVIRASDFFREKTGDPTGALSLHDWLSLPEQALAEATNGRIFRDDAGEFSAIRQRLAYLPNDIRLKKLASRLLIMGQAGQYNYPRCLARTDTAAAQLSMIEFVESALHAVFLLCGRYLPYYKWRFYALCKLPGFSELAAPLEELISSPNTPQRAKEKQEIVEMICQRIADELRVRGLSSLGSSTAEAHAYAVNDAIADSQIRNLHILSGV